MAALMNSLSGGKVEVFQKVVGIPFKKLLGVNVAVQQIIEMLCHMRTPVRVLAAPLPIQVPVHVPGKAAEDGPNPCRFCPAQALQSQSLGSGAVTIPDRAVCLLCFSQKVSLCNKSFMPFWCVCVWHRLS